jgi:dipeptidyl aminopeptidase/acylaminoacyl peptidase
MTGRKIGALAGIVLGGLGCMKEDRLVAVQNDVVQMDGGDVVQMDGGDDAAWGRGPFSAPTVVTLFDSNTTDIHGTSLTPDELEIYFSCARQGEASFHIWSSTRTAKDAKWTTATMVNEITGSGNDHDPDVSPDGLTLYFASDRAGAGYQLYVSRRDTREQQWSSAALMDGQGLSSSTLDVRGPSVNPSGLFMTFCSAPRGTEDFKLYSASRTDPLEPWENVQELSGINSGVADADPALFHDSLSIIWSTRAPSNKSWDLVEVSRSDQSAPFSDSPTRLDSLNTDSSERYPWVSQDGTHILFSRESVGGPGVIYEAWR